MKPSLIKTDLAVYESQPWDGKNTSRIRAFDNTVLVLPDEAAKKTAGGVFMPDDLSSRQSQAAESGIIVTMGVRAFNYEGDDKPRIGDRIYFVRYSGSLVNGKDGKKYRLMTDTAIIGVERD